MVRRSRSFARHVPAEKSSSARCTHMYIHRQLCNVCTHTRRRQHAVHVQVLGKGRGESTVLAWLEGMPA